MLSEEEFLRDIKLFLAISDQLNDQWQLHQPTMPHNTPWLSKKSIIKIQNEPSNNPESDPIQSDVSEVVTESLQYVQADYHIIFSQVYKVPTIFFNLSRSTGAKLRLEEVWTLTEESRGNSDKWSFITEDEHPVLSMPYFCLHPCNTAQFMERLLSNVDGDSNGTCSYVLMWISAVAPIVKLDIPMVEYACRYRTLLNSQKL